MRFLARAALITVIGAGPAAGQSVRGPMPTLPQRLDTLTVRYGDTVIGRGIMAWTARSGSFLQVYEWTSAFDGSSVVDSLFADPATLRPIREVRVTGDTVITVTFGLHSLELGSAVKGVSAPSQTIAVPERVLSSASIESHAAAMPFQATFAVTIYTYYAPPSRLGVRPTRLRVESQETVGGRPAWRVTADTPGGGTTFWVDAATRTILQSDVREGDALITFRR